MSERCLDAGERDEGLTEDGGGFEAKHPVPVPGEGAVTACVRAGATSVTSAIDFNDEAHRGSQEVGDVATVRGTWRRN